MPIRGVLDLQRRSVQLGEIRMGTSVAIEGKKGRKPVRLETFRFTTASEQAARAVAAVYGGTVAPWSQKKGRWEVITDRTAIDVWVPPRGEAVDAWMELWDGPRCLRKCDGITMTRPERRPCMCPQPDDPSDPESVDAARAERKRLAGLRPPQACKPLTRINVTIPELPGLLGVWRLNTGSENAAAETADSGEAMELARAGGKYLPAVVRMEWRWRSSDGSPFQVPVLHIGLSMRELAEGALPAGPGGLLTQLRGAGEPERPALTAGPDWLPPPPEPPAGFMLPPAPEPAGDGAPQEPWQRACAIYQRALAATTQAELKACYAQADAEGLAAEQACIDQAADEWTDLHSALQDVWRDKYREWTS